MNASEKLQHIVAAKNMNLTEIANESGLPPQRLYDIASGKTKKFSPSVSAGILSLFPDISRDWLLFNEGDMLLRPDTPAEVDEEDIPKRDLVLFFPNLLVSASVLENMPMDNQEYTRLALPGLGGCWAITVRGESMSPRVNSGDIVIFDPHTAEWIRNGEMYVVVTRDNHSMIKRVTELPPTEDGSRRFRFISENPDQTLYAPIEIDAQNIIAIYPVRGFLSYQQ